MAAPLPCRKLNNKEYSWQHPGSRALLDEDAKAQRVAILKQYHPDMFNWSNVVITKETPAEVGDMHRTKHFWAKAEEAYHLNVKKVWVRRQSKRQD
jgi:hypothetical protein